MPRALGLTWLAAESESAAAVDYNSVYTKKICLIQYPSLTFTKVHHTPLRRPPPPFLLLLLRRQYKQQLCPPQTATGRSPFLDLEGKKKPHH